MGMVAVVVVVVLAVIMVVAVVLGADLLRRRRLGGRTAGAEPSEDGPCERGEQAAAEASVTRHGGAPVVGDGR